MLSEYTARELTLNSSLSTSFWCVQLPPSAWNPFSLIFQAAADVSDTEEDTLEVNAGGWVVIPDATDAIAPLSPADLLHHVCIFS